MPPWASALTATEFVNTLDRISYEWASLPPGRYGQPSYSFSQARQIYCSFAGCDGQGGGGSKSCSLGGHSYATNTCTETKQCDDGVWVDRFSDPSACL